MITIHLDQQGKTARVSAQTLPAAKPKPSLVQKTSAGVVQTVRLINGINAIIDPMALQPAQVIEADPELNLAHAGKLVFAEDLSAAYFDANEAEPKPVGDFKEIDIVFTATGEEKERRPHLSRKPNLNDVHPVKLGKRMPMADALTGFVFKSTLQIVHEDGVTRDFLYGIAKELHEKQEVALVGTGPKGNQPLVIREHGTAYRGFLYGEIGEGEKSEEYQLLLLLSDQELRRPVASNVA